MATSQTELMSGVGTFWKCRLARPSSLSVCLPVTVQLTCPSSIGCWCFEDSRSDLPLPIPSLLRTDKGSGYRAMCHLTLSGKDGTSRAFCCFPLGGPQGPTEERG